MRCVVACGEERSADATMGRIWETYLFDTSEIEKHNSQVRSSLRTKRCQRNGKTVPSARTHLDIVRILVN